MSVFRRLFVFVCLLFSVAVVAQLPSIHPTLSFEPNKGQADPSVRFLARSMNNTIFLTDNRVVLNANSHHGSSISLTMTGASISAPVGELPTGGMANYYLSNKRDNWRDHLPLYAAVRYPSVYPGVDVVLHQHEDQLELDFEVAPGSSAAGIQLTVDNADQIFVEDGVLNIAAGNDV